MPPTPNALMGAGRGHSTAVGNVTLKNMHAHDIRILSWGPGGRLDMFKVLPSTKFLICFW